MKLILLLFLNLPLLAYSMPKKLEVWFISTMSNKQALNHLDKASNKKRNYRDIAQSKRQCQPMGEYCFDPQIGLYKKSDNIIEEVSDYTVVDDDEKYEKFDAGEGAGRKMIDCDKGNFFDLYCGKAKAIQKANSTKITLWIDVSSTMKQVDFEGYDKPCKREMFLKKLNRTCPFSEEMKVYIFNETRKELGMMDRVCLNSGLNRTDRMMDDIKINNSKHLIIITDIYEASEEFIDFVEASGVGTIKGLDKPIYAENLYDEVPRLTKSCR